METLNPQSRSQLQPSVLLLIFSVGIYQVILGVSIGLYGGEHSYIQLLCTIPVIIMAWGSLFVRSETNQITRIAFPLGLLMLAGQLITFASTRDMYNFKPASTWEWILVGLIIGVIGLLGWISCISNKNAGKIFTLAFAVFTGLSFYVICHASMPKIDVWVFHQDSADAILKGINPYDITFVNVYGDGSHVYSPEVQKDGRVLFGFPYLPMSLWMYLPSYILTGESRYAHALAYALCGLGIGLLTSRRLGLICGTLLLTAPACWRVLQSSWTEPFLLLALVGVAWCAIKIPRLLPVSLGIFLSIKQYNIIFLPLVLLILPRPFFSRQNGKFLLYTFLTIALVTFPLAFWNFSAFWNSTVTIQLKQPFRLDAFSFLSMYANLKEAQFEAMGMRFVPPGWWSAISFMLLPPTWAILLWKCPKNTGGFVLSIALTTIVFLFSNRQAFLNYHTFAAGSILLAIALFEAQIPRRDPQAAD